MKNISKQTKIITLIVIVLVTVTYTLLTKETKEPVEVKQHESKVEVELSKKDDLVNEALEIEKQETIIEKVHKEKEVKVDDVYIYDIPLKEETQRYIAKTSEQYNISYELVLAVAKVESNFDYKVVTSEGSMGLFQIHQPSGTLSWLAKTVEVEFDNVSDFKWDNPKHNASAAIWYLDYIRNYWLNNGFSEEDILALTLGSYNMGIGGFTKYIKTHDPYDWYYVNKVLAYKIKLEKERYGG